MVESDHPRFGQLKNWWAQKQLHNQVILENNHFVNNRPQIQVQTYVFEQKG